MIKKTFLLIIFIASASAIFAQAENDTSEDFWIGPVVEMTIYSVSDPAFGGGLAFGYGKGVSIGLKGVWIMNDELATIELSFLLRFYLLGMQSYSGPFLQITAGPSLFFRNEDAIAIPSKLGMISAGLSFGWRFILGKNWFIEPAVRGGYPFIVGAGVSGGFRF